MKKLLILFSSTALILILVFFGYTRNLQIKKYSSEHMPIIGEDSIAVFYIPNFEINLIEFLNTTINKSLFEGKFYQLIDLSRALMRTKYAAENIDTVNSVFISFQFDHEENEVDSVFFFLKKIKDIGLIETMKRGKRSSQSGISSFSVKGASSNYVLYCVELDDYIIISQSKKLVNKSLKESENKQKSFLRKNIDPNNYLLIVNPIILKTCLNTVFAKNDLPKELDLTLDSYEEKIYMPIRFTDRCLSLNIFLKKSKFKFDLKPSSFTKYNIQDYCTSNVSSIAIFNTLDLESFIDDRSKKNYLKTDEDRLFAATLSSLFNGSFGRLNFSFDNDAKDYESIVIMEVNDAKFFTELLFARDLISLYKGNKGDCPIYNLSDCVLNKYFAENIFPNTNCRYMIVLGTCIALSKNPKTLALWYDYYSQQKLWEVPKRFITHISNLEYVVDMQKMHVLVLQSVKPKLRSYTSNFLFTLKAATLQIDIQKDGMCNISSVIVW